MKAFACAAPSSPFRTIILAAGKFSDIAQEQREGSRTESTSSASIAFVQ
jgi:hypothetical protein